MIEFLAEYGLFLLKVATVVVGIVVVIVVAASAGRKGGQEGLEIEMVVETRFICLKKQPGGRSRRPKKSAVLMILN